MHIEKAKQLKVGQVVNCPADRGDAAFTARVTHVSQNVCKNLSGTEYLWVTVKGIGSLRANGGVWPSNRLG